MTYKDIRNIIKDALILLGPICLEICSIPKTQCPMRIGRFDKTRVRCANIITRRAFKIKRI